MAQFKLRDPDGKPAETVVEFWLERGDGDRFYLRAQAEGGFEQNVVRIEADSGTIHPINLHDAKLVKAVGVSKFGVAQ